MGCDNLLTKSDDINDDDLITAIIESEQVGIVVLTGGKQRIEKGVDLLLKGYGKKLFISGVFMPSEIEIKFENEKEKNELFKCCVFFW